MLKTKLVIYLLALITLIPNAVTAEDSNTNQKALNKSSAGKVIWDINVGSPAKLALYLRVIKETYQDMVKQGMKPEMVLSFRGESVRVISTEHEAITLKDVPEIQESAKLINELTQLNNVKSEACSISARIFEIEHKAIPENIQLVENSFVSIIKYQSMGYALIPIY